MKTSFIAAFLSAFVIPGAGHLYLKRYGRGSACIITVLIGLGVIVYSMTTYIHKHADAIIAKIQSGTASLPGVIDMIRSGTSAETSYYDSVLYFLVCLWVFALIDAYRIGKCMDADNK